MSTIEEFIQNTNAAKTPEQVFAYFEKALHDLGYDRFCYSLITDHPSLGLKAGHGVIRNYSEDWMKHYSEKGYEKIDPVPKFCFQTHKPFTWDFVTETQELNTKEIKVMNEAHEAQLYDGVAVPLYGINGELAGVGMASSAGRTGVNKDMLSVIRALSFQFHLAYTEKEAQENKIKNVSLTPREKEILLWSAEGKSMGDIGDIIGISYDTVKFHMKNIFVKLEANERTYAVVKAIRYGLILPNYVADIGNPTRVGSSS